MNNKPCLLPVVDSPLENEITAHQKRSDVAVPTGGSCGPFRNIGSARLEAFREGRGGRLFRSMRLRSDSSARQAIANKKNSTWLRALSEPGNRASGGHKPSFAQAVASYDRPLLQSCKSGSQELRRARDHSLCAVGFGSGRQDRIRVFCDRYGRLSARLYYRAVRQSFALFTRKLSLGIAHGPEPQSAVTQTIRVERTNATGLSLGRGNRHSLLHAYAEAGAWLVGRTRSDGGCPPPLAQSGGW